MATEAATIDPATRLESGPKAEDHSILKQIINPGGDKYDETMYGSTARVVDDQSNVAEGSGSATQYGTHQAGSTPATMTQTDRLADGSSSTQAAHPGSGTHNYGRDATVAGSAGAAGVAIEKSHNDNSNVQKGDTILAATGTAPISKPLGSSSEYEQGRSTYGTPAGTGYTEQLGASSSGPSANSGVQGAHINPIGAPEASLENSHSHLGRDAAVAGGLATAGAGAGYAATRSHDNVVPIQINTAPEDVKAATYTARSYPVGGTTSTGVDPTQGHVPGEFPLPSGEDPHDHIRGTGAAMAPPLASTQKDVNPQAAGSNVASGQTWTDMRGDGLAPSAAVAAVQHDAQRPASSNYSSPPVTGDNAQHHYGRDAAAAGGVGATGAAAYAAMTGNRSEVAAVPQTSALADRSVQPAQPVQPVQPVQSTSGPSTVTTTGPTTTTTTTTTVMSNKPITTSTNTYQQPPITQQIPQPKEDTHYGRDAAIVGGVGAAGAGAGAAYAAHNQEQSVPGSSTAGKSSSDHARTAAQTAARDHDYHTRDAAAAGGIATTAAAYGAEDPNKHNKLHKPTPDEKHDAKEAEKEHKKHEKEMEKEQKNQEKEAEKEQRHHEKEVEKQQKKHEKELEKQQEEAEKERKPSLIDRILHPGQHKADHDKESHSHGHSHKAGEINHALDHPTPAGRQVAAQQEAGVLVAGAGAGAVAGHSSATGGASSALAHGSALGDDGRVVDPHTGLPMNVAKYGSGQGGTDAAPQIPGFHETSGSGAAGPDWDAIKKSNTPY